MLPVRKCFTLRWVASTDCSTMWQVMHRPQLSWGWKSICDTPWRTQKKGTTFVRVVKERTRKAQAIEILITNGRGSNSNNSSSNTSSNTSGNNNPTTTTNSYNHSTVTATFVVKKSVAHMSQKLHSFVRLTRRMSDASDCDFPKWKSSETRARTLWSNLRGRKNYNAFPNARRKLKQFADSP